ncbi:4-hydroxyphenylacetate 3-monooxygenase [Leptospira perolatii]|uniref:4-hydroxyphenylacetate 3-monooxygenase n=1 Tax=Leptospira perolatii TaxID=2023191 RepID=A0A2M9ZQJ1_9LEPT|nr:4-hydroxyphenylacetate 3-hydroxylase N-terminal domain-containing protein [Leptospira perolatii]PJZ70478.1 4-hydroxyphenylacetate 3-monooxygenase [Leptospira perolatii]PJZ74314.1 4-hydroxyphenylacetate 3-monooxygenase [Leptospira perolatii]
MSITRTGSDYLEDLTDGRMVVCDGTLVTDVPNHPALRGGANTIASLVDLHLDPNKTEMRFADRLGNEYPGAYVIPKSKEELIRRGMLFRSIAKSTGGLMARTPDFLAALLASWKAACNAFGKHNARYAENVSDYYDFSRERNIVHSHAISDPPPDRFLDVTREQSQILRKVGETSEGIIVRGIKMLATLSPLSDELIIYPFRPIGSSEPEQALAFAIPINTPGLKLMCRSSIASGGSEFDHPLAERFDEMDALCIFNDVLVPHNRVFIDGDIRLANELRIDTGMVSYVSHQTCARVAVKAEFLLGVASLVARLSGREKQPSVQQLLGEMAAGAEVLRSLLVSAEAESEPDQFGNFVPASSQLGASSTVASQYYMRSIEILRLIGASGLVMHPSEKDLMADSIGDVLQYFSAYNNDPNLHIQILKLASDLAIGTFGGRQILYEQFYLGAPQAVQIRYFHNYRRMQEAESIVEAMLVQEKVPSA